jgi:hypothetical protein
VAAFTVLALLVVRVVGAVALEALFPNAPDFVIDLVDNYTPAVAALLMLLFVSREGLRGSLGPLGPWRLHVSAVLLPALLTLIAVLVVAVLGSGRFGAETGEPLWSAIPALVAVMLLMVFGEEYGWRGYLLPKLLPLGERFERRSSSGHLGGLALPERLAGVHRGRRGHRLRLLHHRQHGAVTAVHPVLPGCRGKRGRCLDPPRKLQRVLHAGLRAPHRCRPAVVRQPHSRPYCDGICLDVLAASLGQQSHRSLAQPGTAGARKTTGKRRSPAAGWLFAGWRSTAPCRRRRRWAGSGT